jgi:cobalt-zinc-cadmium efflux system outer membrane protein
VRRTLAATAVALVLVSSARAQTPTPAAWTLDDVVARVRERHLAIEAARHRVDAARAEQITARLRANPTLTLSAENVPLAGPTPAGELYEVGASVSQPLEWADTRAARRAVAGEGVALAEAELAETMHRHVTDAKRAFVAAAAADRTLAEARTEQAAVTEFVEITRARFEAGAVPEADVLKAGLEGAKAGAAVADAEAAARRARVALAALLGLDAAPDLSLGPLPPVPMAPDLPTLRTLAETHRPSLHAAERTVTLAEQRAALERSRSTAPVSPFAGVRRVGENTTVLFGISIPLPLTDRNQGAIARAEAEARAARAELELHRRQMVSDVEAAWLAWDRARTRLVTLEARVLRPAEELATIARDAYRQDAVPLLGYLEAQRTRAEARREHTRALADAHAAYVALERAIGRELGR